MATMKRKRPFIFIAFLLVVVQFTSAAIATRPYISIGFGGAFCHPTADYLKQYPGDPSIKTPAFRTSADLSLDVEILNVSYLFGKDNESAIQFGCGFAYINVSKSLPFGISVLKPYTGLGLLTDVDWRIDHRFDLSFRYRFLSCRFRGSGARFAAHQFEIAPYYRLADFNAFEVFVGFPVSLIWKADSVSFTASVAFTMDLDSFGMKVKR